MSHVVTRFKVEAIDGQRHADRVRSLGCCVRGCGRLPIHTHHAKSRGAGGVAKDLVNLCWWHHAEYHQIGRLTWQRKYHLDLAAIASWHAFLSHKFGLL